MLCDRRLGNGESDLKQMRVQVMWFNAVGNHGLKNTANLLNFGTDNDIGNKKALNIAIQRLGDVAKITLSNQLF
jgi:hypothetical protein